MIAYAVRSAATLLAVALLSGSSFAWAMECGDVDDSGDVVASDALAVLRRAIGLNESPLQCPDRCVLATTTTSVTSTSVADQCFDDEDCEDQYPGLPYCGGDNGVTCVECMLNAHCLGGDCGDDYACVSAE